MTTLLARHMFRVGQRVELTEDGLRQFDFQQRKSALRKAKNTGVVVGFGREPNIVRVIPDGVFTVSAFHAKFWKPIEAEASK